ncbi:hypothetical protein Y032_0063g3469 [Ancylostoma ceylanicum]|nr:hypothetical protein Y032_0063g3469 [Ancylostoma ceylanicum]
MVYEVVFKEPLYRIYNASSVSIAYTIKTVSDAIRILLPLVIIFSTHGLWKKTGTYRERPHVTFEGRCLMMLQSADQLVFSSTLPVLNSADPRHFSIAQVEYLRKLENEDDDEFHLDISLPTSNRSFSNLVYFIFFKYQLEYHSAVEAEVALYDSLQLMGNVSSVTVLGRMAADQIEPFRWREHYQLFEPQRRDVEHYKPSEIARRITNQAFNVRLDRKIQFTTGSEGGDDEHFHLRLDISISEDQFTYRTDTWELLKWVAVQYFTAFVIVNYFTNRFLSSLFQSRLIEAIPCCK